MRGNIGFLWDGRITVKETVDLLIISRVTARKLLQGLASDGVIHWHGNSSRDPRQFDSFIDFRSNKILSFITGSSFH